MGDILIKNALIVDGSGAEPYRGDILVEDERIRAVGRLEGASAAAEVEAEGRAVAPGFIDIHSHHDLYLVDQDPVLRFESFVRQGVTTCVIGNCGWTAAPCLPETKDQVLELIQSMGVPMRRLYWENMTEYLDYLQSHGLICNIAHLVGHGTLRLSVMGGENRFAAEDELKRMERLLRESMEAGCFGLSSGLMYYPGIFAHTDELIALARVAGEYGGRYVTHLRGYSDTLPQSMDEALTIARKAGVGLQISHLHGIPVLGGLANLLYYSVKALEAVNRFLPLPAFPNPMLKTALKLTDCALAEGMDVGLDAIPYTLGNTTITVLFPPWANRGGVSQLLKRIANDSFKRRMEADIRKTVPVWPHWEEGSWSDPLIRALGWKPIRILSVKSKANRWTEDKSFPEIGRHWKVSSFEALCRLTLEEEGQATFTYGFPARPWVEKMFNPMLRHPQVSIGADSIMPEFGTPPPSAYGCFPRVLGHYCRELKLFSLTEAVYKMTGLSAKRYGLACRGEIREGAYADLVLFDPATIGERFTTTGKPTFSTGISHVWINGQPVLQEGNFAQTLRPGRILRRV